MQIKWKPFPLAIKYEWKTDFNKLLSVWQSILEKKSAVNIVLGRSAEFSLRERVSRALEPHMLEEYFLFLSSRQDWWVMMLWRKQNFHSPGSLNGLMRTANPSIWHGDKCSWAFNKNYLKYFGFSYSPTDDTDVTLIVCKTDLYLCAFVHKRSPNYHQWAGKNVWDLFSLCSQTEPTIYVFS